MQLAELFLGLSERFNYALYQQYYSAYDMNHILEIQYVHKEKTCSSTDEKQPDQKLHPLTLQEIGTALIYFLSIFCLGPVVGFISELTFYFVRQRRLRGMFSSSLGQLLSVSLALADRSLNSLEQFSPPERQEENSE